MVAAVADRSPAFRQPARTALVAASLAAGVLCGAAVAVVGRPDTGAGAFAVVHARPALCPPHRPGPEDVARATALLEEARAQKTVGAPRSRIAEKLRAGVTADPTAVALLYELGQQVEGRERDDAYACVCIVAPDSRECGAIERARQP